MSAFVVGATWAWCSRMPRASQMMSSVWSAVLQSGACQVQNLLGMEERERVTLLSVCGDQNQCSFVLLFTVLTWTAHLPSRRAPSFNVTFLNFGLSQEKKVNNAGGGANNGSRALLCCRWFLPGTAPTRRGLQVHWSLRTASLARDASRSGDLCEESDVDGSDERIGILRGFYLTELRQSVVSRNSWTISLHQSVQKLRRVFTMMKD